MSKSQRVISLIRVNPKARSSDLVFDVILVIFYICSNSMPTKIVRFSKILTETSHFHSKIVQTIRFG